MTGDVERDLRSNMHQLLQIKFAIQVLVIKGVVIVWHERII